MLTPRTESKVIPVSRGLFAVVDAEDFVPVSSYKWCAFVGNHRNGVPLHYAMHNIPRRRGETRREKLFMHHLVLGVSKKNKVDHVNGDGLDNRKENLRLITPSLNMANSRKRLAETSSRFKGVCWFVPQKKWRASIMRDRKRTFLGYFDNEEDAARAYDKEAVRLFGDYARTNL